MTVTSNERIMKRALTDELDRQEGRTEHDSGNRDGNGIKNSSTVNKNPIEQPVEVVSLCAR